jgi:two-component system response regulator
MEGSPQVILLVEDSEDDADLTLRAFRRGNTACQVDLVRDGQEAVDYLFREGRHAHRPPGRLPALVLLDLKLPRLGGLETLRLIRGNPATRQVPIVVMSCSGEPQDIEASYRLGANSYIRKPVDFDTFMTTVDLLGRYWLETNTPPAMEGDCG